LTATSHGPTAGRAITSIGVCLVLVLSGCGGDDDVGDEARGGTSPTAATSSATTTEPTDDWQGAERQAVIDAYLAAEDAALAASGPPTPDPELPALLRTHTGLILDQRQETILGLRANGWAIRLPEGSRFNLDVESVELEGDSVAILRVCGLDDGERFVVETGEVIASGLVTVELTAAMELVDGVWKLSERREEHQWEGQAGCAAP
jgi:hypothetical protein